MRERYLAIGVVVFVVLAAVLFLGSENTSRSGFAGDFSTHSGAPEGTRAAYLLLERLGYPVGTWTMDLEQVDVNGTLVLVEPTPQQSGWAALFAAKAFSDGEREAVWKWVARGNRLVVFSSHGNDLLGDLGVQVGGDALFSHEPKKDKLPSDEETSEVDQQDVSVEDDEPKKDAQESAEPVVERLALTPEARPWWGNLDHVELERKRRVGLTLVPIQQSKSKAQIPYQHRTLLVAEDGQVVGVEFGIGGGSVVALSSPEFLSNRGIGRAQNATFVAQLLGDQRGVYFDEFRHGYKKTRSLSDYLINTGLWVVVAQLLLAAAFLFWTFQRRFGPLVATGPVRDSSDSVRALAQLYHHGNHRDHALRVLLGRYRRVLASAHRVGEGSEQAFLDALAAVAPSAAQDYRALRLRVLEHRSAEFVALAKELLAAIAATTKGGAQ